MRSRGAVDLVLDNDDIDTCAWQVIRCLEEQGYSFAKEKQSVLGAGDRRARAQKTTS